MPMMQTQWFWLHFQVGEYIRIKALLPNDDMSLRGLTTINATTITTIDISSLGLARKEEQMQTQIRGRNQPPLVLVDDINNDGRDKKQLKTP